MLYLINALDIPLGSQDLITGAGLLSLAVIDLQATEAHTKVLNRLAK